MMLNRSELYKTREYWIERIQNDVFRALHTFKYENNLNSNTALAEKLGVTKGYVSQIMNGNFNFSISKLVDLALTIGVAPNLEFADIEDFMIKEERRLDRMNLTGFTKTDNLNPKGFSIIDPEKTSQQAA